jgi:NAD(P)-dependent dehydrogenase (short-subunit alcohol dehydrogenase family)
MTAPQAFDIAGRVVVVIGGASGIGEAVVLGAARAGARTVALDLDGAAAARVAARAREAGGACEALPLDMRERAAVDRTLDAVRERYGRLDGLVCTPSINVRKRILEYQDEEFDRVVALNLKGTFTVVRAAGRIMTADRRGSIVLFSSIRSRVVEPGQSVYAATKAGIVQVMRAAAAEFGPYGVRVNAVAPGVVDTPLTEPIKAHPDWYAAYAAKSVFGRWGRADEMVGPTLFLLSDAASYVTGTLLVADGGWTAADGRFTPPGMEPSR